MRTPSVRFLFWLNSGTPCSKLAVRLLEFVSFVVGGIMGLWCVQQVEYRFFPVISNWRVEHIIRDGDAVVVNGYLTKNRPCELLAVSILAVPKIPLIPRQLVYQISPKDITGGNVPTGTSSWGPWSVRIPTELESRLDAVARLDVIGTHRCHAFWSQETEYGSVSVEQLK